jgi:hypothetical protein
MKTYKVSLGAASEGRNKETNKRQFRTLLSSGSFLEVADGKDVTVTVNEVDDLTLQNLASRDFVVIAEQTAQPQQGRTR